jgi:hypothetical protein
LQDGFIALNRDGAIPFPSTDQQKELHEYFGAILRSVESLTARLNLFETPPRFLDLSLPALSRGYAGLAQPRSAEAAL